MQKTRFTTVLSLIVCIALIAAPVLTTTGCADNHTPDSSVEKNFTLTVTDADGIETVSEITTDKATVGEALIEKGIISGDNGPYGLYIKTVNGITVDYDKDGKYWAFYVNDSYASAGVDQTEIKSNETYSFKVEQ